MIVNHMYKLQMNHRMNKENKQYFADLLGLYLMNRIIYLYEFKISPITR